MTEGEGSVTYYDYARELSRARVAVRSRSAANLRELVKGGLPRCQRWLSAAAVLPEFSPWFGSTAPQHGDWRL